MEKNLFSVLLEKSPRPHFLIPETVVISDDGKKLTGKVCFPSSRDSVFDRVNHVNLGDSFFAGWNCAHILAFLFFEGRKKNLLAKETNFKPHKIIPPDTDIDIICTVDANIFSNTKTEGRFNVEFILNGQILQEISADFVA